MYFLLAEINATTNGNIEIPSIDIIAPVFLPFKLL
jgi:hypothetical protein